MTNKLMLHVIIPQPKLPVLKYLIDNSIKLNFKTTNYHFASSNCHFLNVVLTLTNNKLIHRSILSNRFHSCGTVSLYSQASKLYQKIYGISVHLSINNIKVQYLIPVQYHIYSVEHYYWQPSKLKLYTQHVPQVGQTVIVPLRSKKVMGVICKIESTSCISEEKTSNTFQVKHIHQLLNYSIPKYLYILLNWISKYYIVDIASALKLILTSSLEKQILKSNQNICSCTNNSTQRDKSLDIAQDHSYEKLLKLSIHQKEVLEKINELRKREIKKPILLHGVTGSGKTEIYFHAIYSTIKNQQQVLILLPEIALTTQIIQRFESNFGFKPIIWHSNLTKNSKAKMLEEITHLEKHTKPQVIIGTRSSLFLPYKNLGLIVVDEEHDSSYKQDASVMYNARDVSIYLANILNIQIILLSATPSLETYYNALSKKYELLNLNHRYSKSLMPNIVVINKSLPQNINDLISKDLQLAMIKTLEQKDQVLLYMNRRGYAPLSICKSCGYRVICKACSVYMVLHKNSNRMICHRCNNILSIPNTCSNCLNSNTIIPIGIGVEKLEEEVKKLFPEYQVQVVSSETMNTNKNIKKIINDITQNNINIIIGTQIITKGYHFPKLNLVGIVDADIDKISGDLRANERHFQILQQVSGRAGRESQGCVYIQTINPNSMMIDCIRNNNFYDFITSEINIRQENNMPPFKKMTGIILNSKNESKLSEFADYMKALAPICKDVVIFGPIQAPVFKINYLYRYRILLQSKKTIDLHQYMHEWLKSINIPYYINIKIDVDPYNFF